MATGRICNSYGYKFKVTDHHLTAKELNPLLQKYDTLGSDALDALDVMFPPPPPRAGWYAKSKEQDPQPDRDTYALLRDNRDKDVRLQKLWDAVNTVPDWVDWEQIRRGQDVFYRYAPAAIAGFAFQGLLATTVGHPALREYPGVYPHLTASKGSAFRPAETLVRTGGHSVNVAKNRLFETFQLMLQVTRSLDAVKPGGEGFASTVRVRLLHSSVRNRILKLNDQRPGYFDVAQFGVPINEVDSMQSVCAFSTNLVWLAMPRQGIYVRRQEALDYLALWRWVTYVIGAPSYVLDGPERALATMESLMYECLRPTANSRALAQNLVKALDGVAPLHVPRDYFEAGTRFVNGDEICDAVGIGNPSLYWKAVVRGQAWLLIVVTYFGRSIPWWDRWQTEYFRNVFWDYIVESNDGLKGGYKYEFKYVPQLGEQTGGEPTSGKTSVGLRMTPLEKIGLASFASFMLLAVVISSLAFGVVLDAAQWERLIAVSFLKV